MPIIPNLKTLLIPHKAKGRGSDSVQYREYGDDMRAIETWANANKPSGGATGGVVTITSNAQFGGQNAPGIMFAREIDLWCFDVGDQFQEFTSRGGYGWVAQFPSSSSGLMHVVQYPYVTAPGFTSGGPLGISVEIQAASIDMTSAINATANLSFVSNEGYQTRQSDFSFTGVLGNLTLDGTGILATAAGIYFGSILGEVDYNGIVFPG